MTTLKRFVLLLAASASLGAAPPPSEPTAADITRYQAEDAKHGAVICAWWIYTTVQDTGRDCFAGKDPEFQAEIDRSVDRVEAFIVANSTQTLTSIHEGREANRKAMMSELAPGTDAKALRCSAQAVGLYQSLRDAGPKALADGVDHMLAVPRPPTADPCL